ncbi:hypothetical protein LOCC1_G008100 [Lachnellula occidentalis]|uniref:Uncharacterized protein n=1 Tax=Lachnellula occidentalis TaxID=215460 RepID=A0A8H8REM9_9HELO|nr:hypothetical protein LOCC1_G008100 [Lachnellula occidentalis]
MGPDSKYILSVRLLLVSLISCTLSHAQLSPCKGCVPEHLLRSETYGIEISSDYLTVAVQHVNGTLEPVTLTYPSLQYQILMNRLLNESNISPYGYGGELPTHNASRSRTPTTDAEIETLTQEITKIVSKVISQGRNFQHYSIAIPSFFTPTDEKHLLTALQRSHLAIPCSSVPIDYEIYYALDTTICPRHFEFNCRPIDCYSKTLIFVEYSDSTLSGYLYQVWGGGYLNRIAYFVDPALGNNTNQAGFEAVAQRVKALIEDNEGRLEVGPINWNFVQVVLFGQLASDSSFRQAVRDALYSFTKTPILPPTVQKDIVRDAVFMGAFGAARGAKRSIDSPSPEYCNDEDSICTRIREKVFRDSLVAEPKHSEHSDEL